LNHRQSVFFICTASVYRVRSKRALVDKNIIEASAAAS